MKIIGSILVLFFAYNAVLACKCVAPDEAKKAEAVQTASIIFSGKVISVTPSDNYQVKVKFQVLKSWKGLEKNEIVVSTSSESAACGVDFTAGETRMIYSFNDPPSVSSCSMLLVDENLVRTNLGEGKSFENMSTPKPEAQETKDSAKEKKDFFGWIWEKITSVF